MSWSDDGSLAFASVASAHKNNELLNWIHSNDIAFTFVRRVVAYLLLHRLNFFLRNEVKLLWLYIFLFATLVEIGQYFNFVDMIGLGEYRIARILFGTGLRFTRMNIIGLRWSL